MYHSYYRTVTAAFYCILQPITLILPAVLPSDTAPNLHALGVSAESSSHTNLFPSVLGVFLCKLLAQSASHSETGSSCYVLIGLHLTRRYIGLHHLFFHLFHSSKPMYDTIWQVLHVRYDLEAHFCLSCTISIAEPPLLQYLVLGELRSLST